MDKYCNVKKESRTQYLGSKVPHIDFVEMIFKKGHFNGIKILIGTLSKEEISSILPKSFVRNTEFITLIRDLLKKDLIDQDLIDACLYQLFIIIKNAYISSIQEEDVENKMKVLLSLGADFIRKKYDGINLYSLILEAKKNAEASSYSAKIAFLSRIKLMLRAVYLSDQKSLVRNQLPILIPEVPPLVKSVSSGVSHCF